MTADHPCCDRQGVALTRTPLGWPHRNRTGSGFRHPHAGWCCARGKPATATKRGLFLLRRMRPRFDFCGYLIEEQESHVGFRVAWRIVENMAKALVEIFVAQPFERVTGVSDPNPR